MSAVLSFLLNLLPGQILAQPGKLVLILAALVLLGSAGWTYLQMRYWRSQYIDLSQDLARLEGERDLARQGWESWLEEEERNAGVVLRNFQQREEIQEKYKDMYFNLLSVSGCAGSQTAISLKGELSNHKGSSDEEKTNPEDSAQRQASFQEWSLRPVPAFVRGLLRDAAPAGEKPAALATERDTLSLPRGELQK
ncbi:MAG: hypothetical protein LBQ63_07910 [Deltaproteobacteria bacterium]|jgi:uncharacterized protein (DUF1330 family)|nr:hypothetical protein [Deltaproteobacteria bacterium]